jgi:hypothetical protein
MLKEKRGLLSSFVVAFVLVFAFVVAAHSESNTKASKKSTKDSSKTGSGLSALTVGKDPGENQLTTPSREEAKALVNKAKAQVKKYPVQKMKTSANGTKTLMIAPRNFHFSVATIGPDGKLTYEGQKPDANKANDCPSEVQAEE